MNGQGIQATADDYNRMVVSSAAALFKHDASGGHQLKINKQAAENTASLLFQTGFAGRAEIGLAGGDDLTSKTSKDRADFKTALQIDHATGRVTFSNGVQDYSAPRGGNLFANSTLALGTAYNYPANFIYDASQSPDMRGSVYHAGHDAGSVQMGEYIPIDPNGVYQLSCYIMQQDMAGDWARFANGNRHQHTIGLAFYDRDYAQITPERSPCILNQGVLEKVETWYQAAGYIGGVDRSGAGDIFNFPQGTSFVKIYWVPNFSNRAGGNDGFPDTGQQRVYFAGSSIMPLPLAHMQRKDTGAVELKVPLMDEDTGMMKFADAATTLVEI